MIFIKKEQVPAHSDKQIKSYQSILLGKILEIHPSPLGLYIITIIQLLQLSTLLKCQSSHILFKQFTLQSVC